MLGDDNPIRPMKDRHFRYIPVDSIKVPNPRKRCPRVFQGIARSIKTVGLQKPIIVNGRNFESTGKYELICGQGRWEIHKIFGIESILAEVVNEDESKAYVMSLVENIARSRPKPLEFAKYIIQMLDSGVSITKLMDITGRSRSSLQDYITLMKKGERSLIKGVENGIIPISFAMRVVQSDDIASQSVLAEAFKAGIIAKANIQSVRKIIDARKKNTGKKGIENNRCQNLDELTTSMQNASEEINVECEYVKKKEDRLFRLLYLIGEVKKDKEVIRLAKEQGISLILKLKKDYSHLIVNSNLPSKQINQ